MDASCRVTQKRKKTHFNESNLQRKKKQRKNFSHELASVEHEEQKLMKSLFGDCSELLKNLDSDEAGDEMGIQFTEAEDSGVEDGDSDHSARQAVWLDEDDEDIIIKEAFASQGRRLSVAGSSGEGNYSRMLKSKFGAIVGTPKWADLDRALKKAESDDDSDSEMLQHCGNFLTGKSVELSRGALEIKRLRDMNAQTYDEGPVITSVQFHPSATIGLVAGLSGITSLLQVDGHTNTKLQSIQFERFPVNCARFTRDGERFFVGSQHHRHYYCFDMLAGKSIRMTSNRSSGITQMKKFEISADGRFIVVCGRFGNIHLITTRSNEHIGSLKMNGEVKSVAFSDDGSKIFSHGDGGAVYVWDIGSRGLIHRFTDEGCITGTSIALSPNGQYLACGSSAGVVNIYGTSSLISQSIPQPMKSILNLTTSITSLKFNASSEILAMSSDEKYNAVKLVHFPTMSVFSNFPGFQSDIWRPLSLDFSKNSGYFSIGNNKRTALLYRLKHYGNY